jgi:uncharacterized protein
MTAADHPTPMKLVLDTSVFTNPDTAQAFGDSAAEAFAAFIEVARGARGLEFIMPPSIYEELRHFLGDGELPDDLELVVALRAPNRYRVHVPGFLLYELIDDLRRRIDRGLRVAERALREAGGREVERSIGRLRDQYRAALRSGLLDSREDVDLILLASELDAAVVSSDRAVVTWAEKLGLRLVDPHNLRRLCESVSR